MSQSQITFTYTQLEIAKQLIFRLMKEKRFFLHEEHTLNTDLFFDCISFNDQLRRFYEEQSENTTRLILAEEEKLGVTPSFLKKNQELVICGFRTGGLEICDAFPIDKFLRYMPESYEALYDEMFAMHHGSVGDVPPNKLPNIKERVVDLTDQVWRDLKCIEINKVEYETVLLLETRFYPDDMNDLAEKVQGMINFPIGLAYLFYKNECLESLIKHNYVLFDAKSKNNPRLHHWSSQPSELFLRSEGGYSCRVKVACLL